MERDVQRTSRKWRRIAAKNGEAVPEPQAIPAANPGKKKNLYEKNAENVQSAVSMGMKEMMKSKKKKKKADDSKPPAALAAGMGLDMFN